MLKRFVIGVIASATSLSLLSSAVFAHVVVTPSEVGIGQHVTFNVSVPNEKQVVVTSLKLDIPGEINDITPTSKDGWTIKMTKNGDLVTDITWANGEIPVGQRQDFSFSAQAPAAARELDWKAYQTYADGTIVHWDQTPSVTNATDANAGPYSVTKVTDDLTSSSGTSNGSTSNALPLALSIVAIILSIGSLVIRRRR